MRSLHVAVGALLLLCGVALPTVLSAMWADYDAARSYLSELGAAGAPHAPIMNYGGFLPVGILWALAAAMLYLRSPKNTRRVDPNPASIALPLRVDLLSSRLYTP